MANKRITQLPIITTASSTDVIPIVSNGVTSQIEYGNLDNAGKYESILYGQSFGDQVPSTTDTTLLIKFGANVTTKEVELNGTGTITILKAGNYILQVNYTLARQGASGGASAIAMRHTVNGNQVGASHIIKLNASAEIMPFQIQEQSYYSQGDVIRFEIIRDSVLSSGAGINEGGLYGNAIQGSGWTANRSSTINILQLK
tara:strand:+ start:9447 stop:10049 length:603 start_codon:yes stop_codon:yes gene_type:complete